MRFPLVGTLLALLVFPATVRAASVERVEEKHENGEIKARYTLRDGKKHGSYTEYDETGKRVLRTSYREGELHGSYQRKDSEAGRTLYAKYRNGVLDGKYKVREGRETLIEHDFEDGRLEAFAGVKAYPRTLAEIVATLRVIAAQGSDEAEKVKASLSSSKVHRALDIAFPEEGTLAPDPDDPKGVGRFEAMKRLQAYRYLCGLAWTPMRLDAELNAYADLGAEINKAIGGLSHHPKNPGWPADKYKKAAHACAKSNLFMHSQQDPRTIMKRSIDAYLFDSDRSNIDRVGHRRWCLNPSMGKVGFGECQGFSAMMAHDGSRADVPPYDVIAYPAPGYFPVDFFSPQHAWSVSLGKRADKSAAVTPKVYPVGEDWLPAKEPLPITYKNIEKSGFAVPWCLIFLPDNLDVAHDKMYYIVLEGLPAPDGGKKGDEQWRRYFVHFINQQQAAVSLAEVEEDED